MTEFYTPNTLDLTPPDNYEDLQIWLIRNFQRVVTFADEVPASASASGVKYQVAIDDDYFYVCIDTDTWKRVAISTW